MKAFRIQKVECACSAGSKMHQEPPKYFPTAIRRNVLKNDRGVDQIKRTRQR